MATWWEQFRKRFGKKPPAITIPTQWGPVTEKYRYLAAMNMKHDRAKRDAAVEAIGEAEARLRYPEAGWDED